MTGLIGKWSCVKILKYNREAVESCQMERPGFFLSRGPFFSFLCISDGGWGTSASLLVGRRRVVIGAVVAHSTEHAFRNVIPFFFSTLSYWLLPFTIELSHLLDEDTLKSHPRNC